MTAYGFCIICSLRRRRLLRLRFLAQSKTIMISEEEEVEEMKNVTCLLVWIKALFKDIIVNRDKIK